MQLRHSLTPRYFAGVFNKRKPTKKDLDHYDVVIIGCNLGGVLSRQLDKVLGYSDNILGFTWKIQDHGSIGLEYQLNNTN